MAELNEDTGLSMQVIEESLQQVLDTQEGDDEFLSTNMFFNNGNSRSQGAENVAQGSKYFQKSEGLSDCEEVDMECDTEEYTPCVKREMIFNDQTDELLGT